MKRKMISVVIDRPLGSAHPQYPEMIYPINYGYVENIIGGDGEAQDAYIVGVHQPIKHFVGELIAIIHRENDCEDKWVAAPPNSHYTVEEIQSLVNFTERYFDISVELLSPSTL